MGVMTRHKQINIRVEADLHRTLETIAQDERRTVPQTARLLLEEGIRSRVGRARPVDDLPGSEIAKLASSGGSFDWLLDEPDLYDDSWGEPV